MQEEFKNKDRLNIAMVCDPIGDSKAGVIMSTLRFAKLLQKRGHNVIFIGAKSKKFRENGYYDDVLTYRFRSIPIPKSGGWNTAFPMVWEIKKIFKDEKIDVVHIILPMTGAISAIWTARSLGINIVAHSHSQPENLFMDTPEFIRPTLYGVWNSFLTWIYGKAGALIYPSELAYGLLEKLNKKNIKSVVVSNGIDTTEFQPAEVGDFYERFNIPQNSVKLLFVGRLFPEKSIDTIIRALPNIIKNYSDIHLMIVGGGHLREKLEGQVEILRVGVHVTFLGLVSEEDKILAYNASDIFVLPSLAELEGMVVLEAMACAKPIIISDAEMSASRFFVAGNGFLFKTKNHEDLAMQVMKLISDIELRKKMGQISLENSKKYDIQRSVDKLEEVYYSLLNK